MSLFFPKVTIGIPTFNRANSFLRESLGSAVRQDYKNLEIVVSDNGSSDNTSGVVNGLNDKRIKYFRQEPPLKPHENANFCLGEATGTYFLLLHDDDLLDDDFISACVESIHSEEVGVVRTGVRKINEKGNLLKIRNNTHSGSSTFKYFESFLKGGAVTYNCNTLFRKECLTEIGGFRSRAYVYQDVIASLRVIQRYPRVDIEEPKSSYRVHTNKLGAQMNTEKWCVDSLEIIDVMCELLPEYSNYFREKGLKALCYKNYSRVKRVSGRMNRLKGYWVVFRMYKYRFFPLFTFMHKLKAKTMDKRSIEGVS